MRLNPVLRQSAVVLCLFLAGSFTVASGAPPAKRAVAHPAKRKARPAPSSDPTKGDVVEYDDPIVRQIAVDALGHEKGSVVVVDPTDGRILTIVNQQMAFSSALEPCSTIKPFVA